jgi:hypothetical protein
MPVNYEVRVSFLQRMKKNNEFRLEEMISSPHSIPSELRSQWREEQTRDSKLFDEIINDLSLQSTNCYECGCELHGPYCPKCNEEDLK